MFTIVPLLLVGYYAFTTKDGMLTISQFIKMGKPVYSEILFHSMWLAFLCTLICLLVGYPAALILVSKDFSKNQTLIVLFILPMWLNFLLRTYAWLSLLEDTGLINRLIESLGLPRIQFLYNEGAVLMGMVYNFMPFMILPCYSALKKMDKRIIEAAEDLGANPFNVFARVTLPLSVPGVVSGITMVFVPAVTTFFIPRLLGGSKFMMFGDLIESQYITTGNWNFGSALALVMMILILISIAVLNLFDTKKEGSAMW